MSAAERDPGPSQASAGARRREHLVDAAQVCFARFGVPRTTVEDIAAEAGVSRATVYRYFTDGRDQIVLAVILREADEFLDVVRKRIANARSMAEALVEGILFTITSVRDNQHLALLFAPEAAGQTGVITGASTAIYDLTSRALGPIFDAAREGGQLRPGIETDDAVEFVLRTVLSLLTVPSPRDLSAAEQRAFLHRYVAGTIFIDGTHPEG